MNCVNTDEHREKEECRNYFWGDKVDEVMKYKDRLPRELYQVLIHCRDSPKDQDWCWENVWDTNLYLQFVVFAILEDDRIWE